VSARLKCWYTYLSTITGLPSHSSSERTEASPGSVASCLPPGGPPSAQSSFARQELYLRQDDVMHRLERRYPFFIAPTSSRASLRLAKSPKWRMRTKPLGRTWIRNRRRNSSESELRATGIFSAAMESPTPPKRFEHNPLRILYELLTPFLRAGLSNWGQGGSTRSVRVTL
jgi:hypothetical protein